MNPLNPVMRPAAGERLQRFVGDRLRITLADAEERPLPAGWSARLRTNLGRAALLREEIVRAHTHKVPPAGASWRDLPMHCAGRECSIDLALTEVGFFRAKAYFTDERGWQHWPGGLDTGIAVHPDFTRTGNTIYCAFTRMFGPSKTAGHTIDEKQETQFKKLDERGYTVIPPSGKLRDLVKELPHVVGTLGCRILHLLPVTPVPTTYARFGRFGSPYACQDFTAIDPALVEFDKRTTGVDQFRELTYAAHMKGARVFLDLAINHTGWGAEVQEDHPEWFVRDENGTFVSPGAWGTIWEDLVELEHCHVALWDYLAEVFLTWCRRGVDGFRCDAGYKVPVAAWQYIIARVRREFPEAVFLLEGLGGAWEATEALLTDGGMQWAYSELFQNYSGREVATYLDHALIQSRRTGALVHYSETHDNPRLADKGREWSLLRNRLCALTSVNGAFGFTCGVEWLAPERVNVHSSRGLAWGTRDNLVAELAQLNRLLADHPCFFDGAELKRLSPVDSDAYALLRVSAEGGHRVLVLVNNDARAAREITLKLSAIAGESAAPTGIDFSQSVSDLLGSKDLKVKAAKDDQIHFHVAAGAAHCLALTPAPPAGTGDSYRADRARAAWAYGVLRETLHVRDIGPGDWRELAGRVNRDPAGFVAAVAGLDATAARNDLLLSLDAAASAGKYPAVVTWELIDRRRVTPVPPGHWLLVRDTAPFRATLVTGDNKSRRHAESIPVQEGHVACFPPAHDGAEATLNLERYALAGDANVSAPIRFLAEQPEFQLPPLDELNGRIVLLTNGIGGMARLGGDLGAITSKYDCLLGANLNSSVPVNRHVFAKRARVWVNADGFIMPLDGRNISDFTSGPPAVWKFTANAGDGRVVTIRLTAGMLEGRNTTVLHFERLPGDHEAGVPLPEECDVRLTVRVDIEDRNFHTETHRNGGAEHHFSTHTKPMPDQSGFLFAPASDRQLRVVATTGQFHPQPEWCENIPHPVEASRGQPGRGDAYSPGWFELSLRPRERATLVVSADTSEPKPAELEQTLADTRPSAAKEMFAKDDSFGRQLLRAARAFVVRRGEGKTVIAGYPWFLDWGRDSLICARGLLAAGMTEEVQELLLTFARFEQDGTLPNTINGDNASNRDTSDAPLWFGVACEELAQLRPEFYSEAAGPGDRAICDVLRSIATNYSKGTPNGIRMDAESALIWSPTHFTWMDTNHPAGTPREGYPVEIQVLWIRLLRQLERIDEKAARSLWKKLAEQAEHSLQELFWLEDAGYYADVLSGGAGTTARSAVPDLALRSNYLFAVSLGLVAGGRAQRCVRVAARYLVVPGALRTLAPLPVTPPLPIRAADGRLLNNPSEPYAGRYEGDENTRRKPAYHNGTAWTWTFPVFCEALVRAWDSSPEAVAAARAYLGSMDGLLADGCLGQIPEILDGDAPHTQRGCDAQAWGVTEALRVWKLLHEKDALP